MDSQVKYCLVVIVIAAVACTGNVTDKEKTLKYNNNNHYIFIPRASKIYIYIYKNFIEFKFNLIGFNSHSANIMAQISTRGLLI